MKNILVIIVAAMCTISGNAQTILTRTLSLKIITEGGQKAAGVVWHPLQKKYYAAQGGNADFPMVVFDSKGKQLSDTTLTTMVDVRGFWYNPNTKTLQTNGYDDFGWGEYVLNSKGIPTATNVLFEGMNQPDQNSIGAYDYKRNVLMFLNSYDYSVDFYNMQTGMPDSSVTIYFGCKTMDEVEAYFNEEMMAYDWEAVFAYYNENAIIYTGIPGEEIGLLRYLENKVEFYNAATGLLTRYVAFPSEATTSSMLNFSYSNGIYWLFDSEQRIWTGYK